MGASVPLLRDAPNVSVLGDTEHLAQRWRWFLRFGVAEAEVLEDTPDRRRIGHERDHAHMLATASADQWGNLIDLCDQPSPARRGTPALLVLLARLRCGLGRLTAAPDPVRVLAVEERAVQPRVRDVVGEAGEPLATRVS